MDDSSKIINALKAEFPEINSPPSDDICYATTNRQLAVRALAQQCDLVLVVGSRNSSNSVRLTEIAEAVGTRALLIDDCSELTTGLFDGVDSVLVTAGASAPDVLGQQVIQRIQDLGAGQAAELAGVEENITFSMPKELR